MSDIRDNPPPLPLGLLQGGFLNTRVVMVRQIEAAAFERGKAAMQGEIERLKQIEHRYLAKGLVMDELCRECDELRAKLKALEEQKPVGMYCVSYHKGIKAMANTEFQPLADFCEGEHNLYLAAGAKP